jgi:hypothetical protein
MRNRTSGSVEARVRQHPGPPGNGHGSWGLQVGFRCSTDRTLMGTLWSRYDE